MSEPISNGTQYPPHPWANVANLAVDHDLDLTDLMIERGSSGLKRAGGYIREDFLTELQGQQAVRKYREMRDNSPVIGACLYAVEMLCRHVTWQFEAVDDTPEALRYAAIASGMLFDDLAMPWSLLISEILSFLPFGFSFFELIFKRRLGLHPPPLPDGTPQLPSRFNDGYIGLGKIAPRPQDTVLRWEFDSTGGLLGMQQLDPWLGRQAFIPYEKALLFRPTSYKDNPEGRSVLRTAYRPYYLLTHIENTEGIGIERDLTGIPLIGSPPQWWLPSASAMESGQLEMLRHIGRNLRQDEQTCVVYPLIYDQAGNQLLKIELLNSGGAKAINTDPIVQRYELRITQSLLCDMLFLGHEDVGSFALASSKTTTQAMSLGGYLTAIKDEFNRRCVPLLWRLNAFPPAYRPTLTHGDVETVDLTELARFMLSFGRIYPMADLENHIRTMAGLPEREGALEHPLPAAIQPAQPQPPGQRRPQQTSGMGSHGGGSGTGLGTEGFGAPGGQVGLPDLDRSLEPQSLALSADVAPTSGRTTPPRRRPARARA